MDLEDQGIIKETVDEHGRENLVVVLGSPDAESAEIYAETVTNGDPSFAGPLAGVSLRLPVYHILEDEVKEQIDPTVYEQQIGMMEMVLATKMKNTFKSTFGQSAALLFDNRRSKRPYRASWTHGNTTGGPVVIIAVAQ
jgi:hypothetical protein